MATARKAPMAFMSYARLNDKHDDGRLSTFRERLSVEVEVQTGEEFPIFQDREDIGWGQSWRERIDESLDEVTFLIPIITPGFFKSKACRGELERFLEREKKLDRNDLILPVYYVGCLLLDDPEQLETDELAKVIASRQRADWRELRFEPFTTPQVGRMLAQLAVQVRNALARVSVPADADGMRVAPKVKKPRTDQAKTRTARGPAKSATDQSEGATGEAMNAKGRPEPAAKTEPPTHVVDPMGRADFATVTEAIKAADPGDRIVVRPGFYQEGLVLDKPLEIIGDGPVEEIVVQPTKGAALVFKTTMGRVANLTLRQLGGGNWPGADISQGRLELEECDISSQGWDCVNIYGGADPRLRRNRIHDGRDGGVFIFDNGRGTLEDNEIYGNTGTGVAIHSGGNPTLRRNRISNNGKWGITVGDGSGGTFEENDLRANARGAWDISEDSKDKVKRQGNQE